MPAPELEVGELDWEEPGMGIIGAFVSVGRGLAVVVATAVVVVGAGLIGALVVVVGLTGGLEDMVFYGLSRVARDQGQRASGEKKCEESAMGMKKKKKRAATGLTTGRLSLNERNLVWSHLLTCRTDSNLLQWLGEER